MHGDNQHYIILQPSSPAPQNKLQHQFKVPCTNPF